MIGTMTTKKNSKPVKAAAPSAKKKPPVRDKGTAVAPTKRKGNSGAKNLKPWKPGQSGNPLGGKLHDPEIRAIKHLTKEELKTVANLIIKGDRKALQKLGKGKDGVSVLQQMLASVAVRIIDKGDMGALDILLNRLVGKVKDEVAHSGNLPQVVVSLPSNGREAK